MNSLFTRFRSLVSVLALTLALGVPVASHAASRAPVWEVVERSDPGTDGTLGVETGQTSAFDADVRDGYIYITVSAPVKVEVFTILGQLVTSRTIAPGTVRLRLGTGGIYIIKGAGTTRRVNI
ncbi:MAG: hypothetical protein K2J38_06530 [Muribaculaceae bacterium]|nr:hypothetical protein [Muribaculaceae bacterium]